MTAAPWLTRRSSDPPHRTLVGHIPSAILRKLATPAITSVCFRLTRNDSRIDFWNQVGFDLDRECYIGRRVQLIGHRISIGPGSALSGRIELIAWGDISIGRNVMISDSVHLLTGSHDVHEPNFSGIVRPIVVEDNVWIAQGAVILPGVTIGEGAVVGAYAVVPSDVPARSIVVGNPARVVRKREDFEPLFIPAEFLRSQGL